MAAQVRAGEPPTRIPFWTTKVTLAGGLAATSVVKLPPPRSRMTVTGWVTFVGGGVRIVGGCCGLGPAYIRALGAELA